MKRRVDNHYFQHSLHNGGISSIQIESIDKYLTPTILMTEESATQATVDENRERTMRFVKMALFIIAMMFFWYGFDFADSF